MKIPPIVISTIPRINPQFPFLFSTIKNTFSKCRIDKIPTVKITHEIARKHIGGRRKGSIKYSGRRLKQLNYMQARCSQVTCLSALILILEVTSGNLPHSQILFLSNTFFAETFLDYRALKRRTVRRQRPDHWVPRKYFPNNHLKNKFKNKSILCPVSAKLRDKSS